LASPLPNSVETLIQRHIRSIAELDVLLLTRSAKDRSWAADDAARALRTSRASAEAGLDALVREGFLRRDEDGYRYTAGADLDDAVGDLERAYARYRTRVVGMIFQ
jgi:LmbE family N-acetylglucosaminyl deacetylase